MRLHKIKNNLLPLLGILVYYLIIMITGMKTSCYIKSFTGVPCPGCGFTRSFIHLFQGDISKAFYYHPLFFLPVIGGILFLLQYFKKIKVKNKVWIVFTVLLVAVYAVRMILLFPHTAPMDFYKDAFLPRILIFIYKNIHGLFS